MADSRRTDVSYIVHRHNFHSEGSHTIIASCDATQFVISVPLDSLAGTPFHTTYTNYLSKMTEKDDDGFSKYPQTSITLTKTVCDECLAVFPASTVLSESSSLQDYIQPTIYNVCIIKDIMGPNGVVAESLGDSCKSYSWDIAPIELRDLDTRAATVEKLKASELLVTANATTSGMLGQVRKTTGQPFFFKPRCDLMAPEFTRELSVLLNIADCDLHESLRMSRLAGLVVLDSGHVAGILLDWLPALPLAEQNLMQSHNYRQAWKEQVEAIVDGPHRHGIVWGDVNPHNILIDSNFAAWVIDFGGNNNVQFVDEDIKETVAGDKQGVYRIFEVWLPQRPVD